MNRTIKGKICLRNDTSANWSKNNPVLANGEAGFDSTVKMFKIGDGTTKWNSLPYITADISFDFGDEG